MFELKFAIVSVLIIIISAIILVTYVSENIVKWKASTQALMDIIDGNLISLKFDETIAKNLVESVINQANNPQNNINTLTNATDVLEKTRENVTTVIEKNNDEIIVLTQNISKKLNTPIENIQTTITKNELAATSDEHVKKVKYLKLQLELIGRLMLETKTMFGIGDVYSAYRDNLDLSSNDSVVLSGSSYKQMMIGDFPSKLIPSDSILLGGFQHLRPGPEVKILIEWGICISARIKVKLVLYEYKWTLTPLLYKMTEITSVDGFKTVIANIGPVLGNTKTGSFVIKGGSTVAIMIVGTYPTNPTPQRWKLDVIWIHARPE